ncbi:MAG: toprim domain-containing protein, partial [Planctomycetota bacterium]
RGAVHCRRCFTRGTDPAPGGGLATIRWMRGGGWSDATQWLTDHLHGRPHSRWHPSRQQKGTDPYTGAGWVTPVQFSVSPIPPRCEALTQKQRRNLSRMRPGWWKRLAEVLQLPENSLRQLEAAWDDDQRAIGFPMRRGDGGIVGIRWRNLRDASKWSAAGGRAGVFWPRDLHAKGVDRLYVTEGPSDAAALHGLGLDVIGRPSAGGAIGVVLAVIERLDPREIVLACDNDEAGRKGASVLLRRIVESGRSASILTPPPVHGDVREWVAAGAGGDRIQNAAAQSVLHRPRNLFDWADAF